MITDIQRQRSQESLLMVVLSSRVTGDRVMNFIINILLHVSLLSIYRLHYSQGYSKMNQRVVRTPCITPSLSQNPRYQMGQFSLRTRRIIHKESLCAESNCAH